MSHVPACGFVYGQGGSLQESEGAVEQEGGLQTWVQQVELDSRVSLGTEEEKKRWGRVSGGC